MKLLAKILIPVIIAVLLLIGVFFWLPGMLGDDHPVTGVINTTKVAATNAALDASGVKTKAQEALEANSDRIAEATGLPILVVDKAIEQLDVESWQVAVLPRDAQETGTVEMSYNGIDAAVTTYDDPSIVTIEAYGQELTLEVPEDSRQYMQYLSLLD